MATLSKNNLNKTFKTIKEKISDFCAKPSKKRLAVILALTLVLFLVPFYPAQAGNFVTDWIIAAAQTILFAGPYLLIWIFTGIAAVFVAIATFLVNAALSPAIYMGIINSPGIDRGWTIMRDTANLFFILILIFIALATTLRLQSYSAKTWIPKLLFGAVFINFSKTITMFIIDIGNMFMYGAISWMGQGIENTGIGKLNDVALNLFVQLNPLSKVINGGITLTVLVQGFMGFIFNLVLSLTLLGFGILLLVRVTMLAILTIFSPIAYMLHAWPNAGKYAGQWWGSLLKYIVFGPIIVFFLFIAGEMANTLFGMGAFLAPPAAPVGDVSFSSFGADGFLANLIPFIIVIIILLSGLSFTSEMGIAGAGMIMGTVKGLAAGGGLIVGGLAAKQILNKGIRGASWAKGDWSKGTRKAIKDKYDKSLGAFSGYGKKIYGKIPGGKYGQQFVDGTVDTVTTPFRGMKDAYGMAKNIKDRKEIDAEKKKMEILNKSSDDMRKEMRSSTLSPAERAARMERMAEKGDLTDDDKKYLNMATALGTNIDKKLLGNAMPSWAGDLKGKKGADADKEIESKVAELIDNGKIRNINPGDWNKVYKQVEEQLDPEEFDRIISNSSRKTKNNIGKAIEEMIEQDPNSDTHNTHTEGGMNNFKRKSRLALLNKSLNYKNEDGTDGEEIFSNSEAIADFAKYNYKDLNDFEEKDLLKIAPNIDKTTLARIRTENLNPAKAKTIADYIKTHRAGSEEDSFVRSNEVWGGKRGQPESKKGNQSPQPKNPERYKKKKKGGDETLNASEEPAPAPTSSETQEPNKNSGFNEFLDDEQAEVNMTGNTNSTEGQKQNDRMKRKDFFTQRAQKEYDDAMAINNDPTRHLAEKLIFLKSAKKYIDENYNEIDNNLSRNARIILEQEIKHIQKQMQK